MGGNIVGLAICVISYKLLRGQSKGIFVKPTAEVKDKDARGAAEKNVLAFARVKCTLF